MFEGFIDIFIGLSLTFASVALLASALSEALASAFKLRASTLYAGLAQIMNVDLGTAGPLRQLLPPILLKIPERTGADTPAARTIGLFQDLLNHAAINPRGPGKGVEEVAHPLDEAAMAIAAIANNARKTKNAQKSASRAVIPSYINSAGFAAALMDVIQTGQNNLHLDPLTAIAGVPDPQLRQFLMGAWRRAAGDVTALRQEVADWFDSAMDRVSGDYKRYTQVWSFLIAFAVACAFNIDAIAIADGLRTNSAAVDKVQMPADAAPNFTDALAGIKQLEAAQFPIGWKQAPSWSGVFQPSALVKLIGWLMTASAALVGAPFWFDMLSKFINVRGAGPTPDASAKAKS